MKLLRVAVGKVRRLLRSLRADDRLDPLDRAHGENLGKVPFGSGGGPMGQI